MSRNQKVLKLLVKIHPRKKTAVVRIIVQAVHLNLPSTKYKIPTTNLKKKVKIVMKTIMTTMNQKNVLYVSLISKR